MIGGRGRVYKSEFEINEGTKNTYIMDRVAALLIFSVIKLNFGQIFNFNNTNKQRKVILKNEVSQNINY